MPGPLPTGTAVRRNKPTIPTTALPPGGRTDPVPDPPVGYELGPAGLDWWGWAWTTPQACGWSDGDLFAVVRRATLEDDLAALDSIDSDFDLESLFKSEDDTAMRRLEAIIARLRALAGNRLSVLRAATDLDDRLGLTPKGIAQLRWKIVDEQQPAVPKAATSKKRRALKAVPDSAAS